MAVRCYVFSNEVFGFEFSRWGKAVFMVCSFICIAYLYAGN